MGGLEHWIADQSWKAEPDGWTVLSDLNNWRFRLRRVADGPGQGHRAGRRAAGGVDSERPGGVARNPSE
jgi:hypothetical protein